MMNGSIHIRVGESDARPWHTGMCPVELRRKLHWALAAVGGGRDSCRAGP